MSEGHPKRGAEAFFGRRRGKTLRRSQARLYENLLPALAIDPHGARPADIRNLFSQRIDRVTLEIGFGGGEHLLQQLQDRPGDGFIGVEPFVNGMAKFLSALGKAPANLRLYDDDATIVLDWLPEGSLDGIDLFYPDPWPKRRHWKRRFISSANLDRFSRLLKPGGVFRFASDIPHYVNWTLLHFRDHPHFEWQAHSAEDWQEPFPGWSGTRYEAKAMREGRRPAYLVFARV